MGRLATKRVYEDSTEEDGLRILVDRMWPRGISKDDERVDEWLGEVAPTEDLRKWFHEHKDFANFTKKYRKELSEREESRKALRELRRLAKESGRVTLVYASKDEEQNNAVVLKRVVEEGA